MLYSCDEQDEVDELVNDRQGPLPLGHNSDPGVTSLVALITSGDGSYTQKLGSV